MADQELVLRPTPIKSNERTLIKSNERTRKTNQTSLGGTLGCFVIVGLTAGSHERVSFGSVNGSPYLQGYGGISESAFLWSAFEDQGEKCIKATQVYSKSLPSAKLFSKNEQNLETGSTAWPLSQESPGSQVEQLSHVSSTIHGS